MKELTRIITVQFTTIDKFEDYDTEILTKDEHAKYVKDDMERLFKVDDVVVTNVQDFIRDCDETDTDLE